MTEKIWYLLANNQSPTLTAVVKEKMKRAQQLPLECGKCEIALTYNLAFAKMTKKTQIKKALHLITSLTHLDHFILKWPILV